MVSLTTHIVRQMYVYGHLYTTTVQNEITYYFTAFGLTGLGTLEIQILII